MGANEKYEAAMHGAQEYTPTTDELRDIWVDYNLNPLPRSQGIPLVETAQADFDRWLETVRAEAKAEALNESATELNRLDSDVEMYDENLRATQVEWWLRARANQYKEAPSA